MKYLRLHKKIASRLQKFNKAAVDSDHLDKYIQKLLEKNIYLVILLSYIRYSDKSGYLVLHIFLNFGIWTRIVNVHKGKPFVYGDMLIW